MVQVWLHPESDFTLPVAVMPVNDLSAIQDSSIVALGGGAVYTGAAFNADGWGRIVGSILADQNGTLNVEQRNDGVNWDVVAAIAYTANIQQGYSIEVVGNEARLRYVNGGVAQAVFRLYGRLRRM